MLLKLSLLSLLLPMFTQLYPLPSLSQSSYCCACPWVLRTCSLVNRITVFHPVPPSPLDTVSLFYVSMLLFLFCLLVYCVHLIPHISEFRWYLSFTDWLISLSIIFSRSTHAVAKGKHSIFFTST